MPDPQTTGMRIMCASCGRPLKPGERLRVFVGNATLHEGCLERWLVKANMRLREENRRLRRELQAAVGSGFPSNDRGRMA